MTPLIPSGRLWLKLSRLIVGHLSGCGGYYDPDPRSKVCWLQVLVRGDGSGVAGERKCCRVLRCVWELSEGDQDCIRTKCGVIFYRLVVME